MTNIFYMYSEFGRVVQQTLHTGQPRSEDRQKTGRRCHKPRGGGTCALSFWPLPQAKWASILRFCILGTLGQRRHRSLSTPTRHWYQTFHPVSLLC